MPRLEVWSYPGLLRRRRIPWATYIFTDFDRMRPWERELAARAYRIVRRAGALALNDPALFRDRHGILTALHAAGINSFRAWAPGLGQMPDRFPCFLRTQAAHRGVLTQLLDTPERAQRALAHAVAAGHPLSDLVFVEYRAEPIAGGNFAKRAAFRIGEAIVPTVSVHDTKWSSKTGRASAGSDAAYAFDFDLVRGNPYRETLMAACETVGIAYGRIDFGLVDGRPEIYEINTNPFVGVVRRHPSKVRIETFNHYEKAHVAAMQAIDAGRGQRIALDDGSIARHRAETARTWGLRAWMP